MISQKGNSCYFPIAWFFHHLHMLRLWWQLLLAHPTPTTSLSGLPQIPEAFWHHMGSTILFNDSWFTPRSAEHTLETWGMLIRFPNRPASTGCLHLQVEFILAADNWNLRFVSLLNSIVLPCFTQWNDNMVIKAVFHYLTTAEYITGCGLDVEVSEDTNSLIFSLLWTVEGEAATFADLRSQLNKSHRECVNAVCSQGYMSSYSLLGKAVHRWVWHGLQLVLTDTHTETDYHVYI